MTEKQLQTLYHKYNKKYFDGKLPQEVPVKFVDMSETESGGLCTTIHHEGLQLHVIYLDSTFKDYDNLLKFFLLHEMCHLAVPAITEQDAHGQRFDDEMNRLAFRGAFKGIW